MTEEQPEPGIGEGPATAISASLPQGTVAALRAVAGSRGVSAFITAAVEKRLRDIATEQYLAEYQQEHGAFTEEELRAADAILNQAERREAAWRKAS